MKILINDQAETIIITENVTVVVEVADAIFPPGISSVLLENEGDMIVRGSSAPQKLAAATANGLSPISDDTVSGGIRWGTPGGVGLGLWNEVPGSPVRVGNTSFQLSDVGGGNNYAALLKGVVLKWSDTGATKRAAVVATSYSTDVVTVTIAGDILDTSASMSTMQYTRFHRELQCYLDGELTVKDDASHFTVPLSMDGWTIVWVYASVDTGPSGGVLQFQINNGTNDILSTALTIDTGENHSKDAATPPVINSSYKTLSYGSNYDIDTDTVTGTPKDATIAIVASPI